MISYKDCVKKIRKEKNISEKEFQNLIESGKLTVRCMHPVLKKILPYKVIKINEDGKIDGYFMSS